ncbi:hypothetical protein PoB_000388100 [Plakobranchus ocellatus]|uniref:Uncharacterized protein n=1 Tax=Plakobranchus ocellatus TaxID=259542 RepID=A0AAV3XM53_9GAST|nr:hypothetical protein PoB_000388100 [Plakobranchus ocellatus]
MILRNYTTQTLAFSKNHSNLFKAILISAVCHHESKEAHKETHSHDQFPCSRNTLEEIKLSSSHPPPPPPSPTALILPSIERHARHDRGRKSRRSDTNPHTHARAHAHTHTPTHTGIAPTSTAAATRFKKSHYH